MHHGVFEWLQEIFLELKVCKLLLLKETHSKLTQRIQSEERYRRVCVAADAIEMLAKDAPHVRPLESDATHVVVRNVNEFLQAE